MIHRQPRLDTYLQKGMRRKLVRGLREKGIHDERVLAAMEAVPRHFFLDPAFERIAYEDRAFPIAAGQTISQPYTVAFQTQLLELRKFDKVLEIGTGSGYQACVLAAMGAMVYTMERQRSLYDQLGQFFYLKSYPSMKRFYGDGYQGLPSFAPFDRILITAGAPSIPEALIDQLKPGGMMVVPVGNEQGQTMVRLRKDDQGKALPLESFGDFIFVPMLGGRNQ